MKRNIVIGLILFGFSTFVVQSCVESGCGKSMEGDTYGEDGERMVGNCMDCHSPNGGAGGCFRIGGTAYDSIPGDSATLGAVVKLYTQPFGGGDLIMTLRVDLSGNFYTTSPVSWGNGLYPMIISGTGIKRYMPNPTTIGACNSCHGNINPKIWAD